jgi:hypothetical protein
VTCANPARQIIADGSEREPRRVEIWDIRGNSIAVTRGPGSAGRS